MGRVKFISVGDKFDENDGPSVDGEWIFDFEIKDSESYSGYRKIDDLP
jgi:hypothetical protein